MKPTFIENPFLSGEGRCGVCDYHYAQSDKKEVAAHRAFHRRYVAAAATGHAPVREELREAWWREAAAVLEDEDASRERRLQGAQKYLAHRYHGYLGSWLYYGGRRLDLWEYFTRWVDPKGLMDQFGRDVAAEMRREYSLRSPA